MEPLAAVAVRQAVPDDLDRIVRIEAASFEADRFPRRNLSRMLRGGRTRFLLAGDDGYLALCFRRGSGVARIYSLAVRPEGRGKGVARALLQAARDTGRAAGAHTLRLEVRESNASARRLYEEQGFRLRRRLSGYYDDGETALQLEASLDPEDAAGAGERSAS